MIYQQIKALKQELDTFRPLSKEQEGMIMQKFRLDWNYHSNHLEGNTLTYGETKALILFGLTAQGKPLKDHFEITGHDEAVKWIEDIVKQERPLTESFIRELHTLLLKESYEKKSISAEGIITTRRISVGQYKTVPNHVLTQTGEIFYFATPEETPAKMGDLMAWYQEEQAKSDIQPILLATEFHYRFIRIHPFDDGNGRTARLIMNFILMRFGYPPVIIRTDDKENYFNVLRLADAGNLQPFVEYIAQNLIHSLTIMIKGAKGESIEEPDDLDKEIALLEQKLKGMGDTVKIDKNKITVKEVYINSFIKLSETFIKQSQKFEKFYLKNRLEVFEDNKWKWGRNVKTIDYINSILQKLNSDYYHPKRIGIRFLFENMKQLSLIETSFLTGIMIDFEDSHYAINVTTSTKLQPIKIKKPYSEQLTDEEINQIVKSEMKRHTEFIESKIKEME
ncbi:Fic family protein [Arcicella sp. LKC2W]|uniref:Fic family protein n=1 Tax=Arcicella sp. LKC2W TaxID=2984198 RepID=UPI002B20B15B|nr:Fic family protein [Arcicella sp. LKC2W]MEA5459736.1 Fic family protein [Arcicella sp. LKC2W]